MENSEDTTDDQGSGWLQVKKKHRGSSKLSLQSWVGGLKGKDPSPIMHSQPLVNEKSRKLNGKCKSNYTKPATRISQPSKNNTVNSNLMLNENESSSCYQDKCVINKHNDCSKSPISRTIDPTEYSSRTLDVTNVSQMSKLDVVHKIKWGDLDEEDALLLDLENIVTDGSVIGGRINNNMVVCKKSENVGALVSCCSSPNEPQESKSIEIFSNKNEPFKGKEKIELCTTDLSVSGADSIMVSLSGYSSKNDVLLNSNYSSGEQDETIADISEVSNLKISKVGMQNGGSNPDRESDFFRLKNCESEMLEGSGEIQDAMFVNDSSKTQNGISMREGEACESKERFRERLWCFLFENLNRTVDELYLLSELECDVGQMKEVVLVLEEAASDFKDLNNRVEEFENMSKVASVTMKSEHRRPHALSWEVRRMTISPHRAEILSSSLEAFKKIQQERTSIHLDRDVKSLGPEFPKDQNNLSYDTMKSSRKSAVASASKDSIVKLGKQGEGSDLINGNVGEKQNIESIRSNDLMQNGCVASQNLLAANSSSTGALPKENSTISVAFKNKKEQIGFISDMERLASNKDEILKDTIIEKHSKYMDHLKRQIPSSEKDKEKEMRSGSSRKSMDAWKEKRNWGDILTSPLWSSSHVSYSPRMSRKSVERTRILHDKLMSPEKKKKTALDLKREAEGKHARAMRIRGELENERVQKLQRTSEKLNRINEIQAVRSLKLREGMYARHQRSESRHEAFLAQVVRRAGDESSKVNEVRFITSMNEENKKLILRQKLQDSELRRAEKLLVIKTKQKEDIAREEAVLERRRLLEAEKQQRLAETQRRKEEAQSRREEERKASSAAREVKAIEQLRRKEARAKAKQEEAELLALKLAERLSESEQRRKVYLEQIRERASMDFRDQTPPLPQNSFNKEIQGRPAHANSSEEYHGNNTSGLVGSSLAMQQPLKRRVKKIRQRLMAMKHEVLEPQDGLENGGIGYRTSMGTARAKIGRWIYELQRLRQARKEGAATIGLITAEMIKFLNGKKLELISACQAGLLDFIASALPASHTSKPETCQVTIYLLRLLRVVLSIPSNLDYFLAQNLLPPIIPMLSAILENYIKIAASLNVSTISTMSPIKTSNFESISEVVDGFLWTVTAIIGHKILDERQLQMQDGLLELVVVYQIIHHIRDLFALYDRPQVEGSPFPSSIILSLKLLMVLTSRPGPISPIQWKSFPIEVARITKTEEANPGDVSRRDCTTSLSLEGCTLPDPPANMSLGESCEAGRNDESKLVDKVCEEFNDIRVKSENGYTNLLTSSSSLLSAISETGLVCLPSLLTVVLLQANNKLSYEQASYVLPSNFEEVATAVLKILNNLAVMDIALIQRMLSRPDLKMEFFHLMSFLLSHCTNNWTRATDQVGQLLLESLLLLGYFALFHHNNQAVLRWGKSPTILHKVCDLPFVFFSDPELMPLLAGTLVATCYGCEQNKDVIQHEISTDMLLSLLKSCNNNHVSHTVVSNMDNHPTDDCGEPNNLLAYESLKIQPEIPFRPIRSRSNPASICKGGGNLGNSGKICKARNQRYKKAMKTCEKKQNSMASDTSMLTLHRRFPSGFVHEAEQFFMTEATSTKADFF